MATEGQNQKGTNKQFLHCLQLQSFFPKAQMRMKEKDALTFLLYFLLKSSYNFLTTATLLAKPFTLSKLFIHSINSTKMVAFMYFHTMTLGQYQLRIHGTT